MPFEPTPRHDRGPGAAPPTSGSLSAADLLPWPTYGRMRQALRPALIRHRRARSIALGPHMRLLFEDGFTLRHQIQEVLHAERAVGLEAMQHEIDRYAPLLPDGTNWKATLMIELMDADERRRDLPGLSEAAHHVYVAVAGTPPVVAHANEDQADRHLGRPSGVHFLRFQLPCDARAALLDGAEATLGCAHPHYRHRQPITAALIERLRADIAPLATPHRKAAAWRAPTATDARQLPGSIR